MREALIVSTARTSLAKSQRGTFNITHPITLAGHVIDHAIRRAGVEHEVIEDVLMGTGYPEGASGSNIARNAAIKAGCPVTTAGATINRYRTVWTTPKAKSTELKPKPGAQRASARPKIIKHASRVLFRDRRTSAARWLAASQRQPPARPPIG